jgi:small subunit ribosomal protein S7e
MSKVVKTNGKPITALERLVTKTINEIQVPEVQAEVPTLYLVAAKQVAVAKGRKAIVLFIPFRQQKRFGKIQKRLIAELEKKFTATHVVVAIQRTIMSENMARWTNQKRAHSRTLTAVYDAILNDIVAPTTIVGKRIRFKTDGTQLLKVYLDKKDQKDIEDKAATFAAVYKKLTARNVAFSFQ